MQNSESFHHISFKETISIWWSMMWRMLLVTVIAGIAVGFIGGLVMQVFGRSHTGDTISTLISLLWSFAVSIWALRSALSTKHGGCSVVLVKNSNQ